MIEHEIDVATPEGAMNTFVVHPDGGMPWATVVVLLPDYPGEMYLAFAEHDDYAPLEMVGALRAFLATTPLRHRVEVYDGTHHGFAFTDRGTFDRAASERHYERLFALLQRNLVARA